ncbi:MAG TPA: hypothetical protein VIR98_01435 [Candidatus Paceibacterota bacterium]|jgi:hypothetical protein
MRKLLLIVTILCASFPSFVLAHSTGESFEKVIGAYKVDIGYGDAAPGEAATFDLKLFDASGESKIPFDNAWVRIERDGKTFFAGPIANQTFGVPAFSIAFPTEGSYEVSVRFTNGQNVLAEATFPYQVEADEDASIDSAAKKSVPVMPAVTTAAIVAVAAFFIGRVTARG